MNPANAQANVKEWKVWCGHEGLVLDSVDGFEVIECRSCCFRHVVPIPTAEELDEIYRSQYYTAHKPLYVERNLEDLDWWNLVYSERYDTFEEILPSRRRRLLDVGSGPGYFLLQGLQRGWRTAGIEPSAQAAAHSRKMGLEIHEAFLTPDSAERLGRFDVVHLSEVLEHVPDPAGMLRLIHGLLDPGGLICVVVPNDYNPIQDALRKTSHYKPWWLQPPHHINYFDFDSIGLLLERCGFGVLRMEATFPIDLFLLMGDHYVDNDLLGRQCHARRKRLEQLLDQSGLRERKRRWYRALAMEGLGREAVLFGQRSNEAFQGEPA